MTSIVEARRMVIMKPPTAPTGLPVPPSNPNGGSHSSVTSPQAPKSVVVTLSAAAIRQSAAAAAKTPVSAASAISSYTNSKTSGPFLISDSSANISSSLDALQVLAKAGKITSISYTDDSPSITIAAAKLTANKEVIAKLGSASRTISFAGNIGYYSVVAGTTAGSMTITGGTEKSVSVTSAKFLKFNDITTVANSGDANINALLYMGKNGWWSNGSGASGSANTIKSGVTALSTDSSRHTINYSFMSSSPSPALTGVDATGFAVMNATQKAAVQSAFSYLSTLINVTFTDVTNDGTTADISFGTNNQSKSSSAGYANIPHMSGSHQSYLMLANDQSTNNSFDEGSYGWETLLHEIGHTLGLKHPGNYNAGGGGAPTPYMATTYDSRRFAIMSYNNPTDIKKANATNSGASPSAANPSSMMTLDIAALQFLYGANTNVQASTTVLTNTYADLKTVWAPTVGSAIDASATTAKDIIDMRGGGYSSIAINYSYDNTPKWAQKYQTYKGMNNFALAYGSQVTSVKTGSGDDVIYTGTLSSTIDAGTGKNTIKLAGKATDWSKTTNGDGSQTWTNASLKIAHTILNASSNTFAYYDATTTSMTHTS